MPRLKDFICSFSLPIQLIELLLVPFEVFGLDVFEILRLKILEVLPKLVHLLLHFIELLLAEIEIFGLDILRPSKSKSLKSSGLKFFWN